MVQVTKFDGSSYYLSPHQIEFIEANPDTTVCLVSGKKVIVKETAEELNRRILAYYARVERESRKKRIDSDDNKEGAE